MPEREGERGVMNGRGRKEEMRGGRGERRGGDESWVGGDEKGERLRGEDV